MKRGGSPKPESNAFSFSHVKEICNLETFSVKFYPTGAKTIFCFHFLVHFFFFSFLLGENEFNDLQGLVGFKRCCRELLRFRASVPAIHCFTSSWPRSDCTAAGWKDGGTNSRIGMFLLLVLLGQREHWRSSWLEAVLQPDHRHKLTTCVLVYRPDQLPRLWETLEFPQQDLYWKKRQIKDDFLQESTEYEDVSSGIDRSVFPFEQPLEISLLPRMDRIQSVKSVTEHTWIEACQSLHHRVAWILRYWLHL